MQCILLLHDMFLFLNCCGIWKYRPRYPISFVSITDADVPSSFPKSKHKKHVMAIAIPDCLWLPVRSQSSGPLHPSALFVTVLLNRVTNATKVLRPKLKKKEKPLLLSSVLSNPHFISTKRFTCHHRLPSSFNKCSKRKCLALSGRVWLFKTIGIPV